MMGSSNDKGLTGVVDGLISFSLKKDDPLSRCAIVLVGVTVAVLYGGMVWLLVDRCCSFMAP